jgi:hypothetical protein
MTRGKTFLVKLIYCEKKDIFKKFFCTSKKYERHNITRCYLYMAKKNEDYQKQQSNRYSPRTAVVHLRMNYFRRLRQNLPTAISEQEST